MRTKSTIMNLSAALIGQVVGIIANVAARIVFVRLLSAEYLGLSGLFSNILSVFSLVELGIGPAMAFSLYKPLASKDVEKIKSLMQLYKNVYRAIGIVVFALGWLCLPIYPFFIKETLTIPNIDAIYLLYVANVAISYLYSYKRSLIICDQKKYIATIFRYAFFVLMNLAQIIILLITRNYILFLLMQVAFTWLENWQVSRKADQLYPFLKDKNVKPIDAATKAEIKTSIGAMLFHKIGSVVVSSTDNILISSLIGIAQTGIYSNYQLIITAVKTVFGQIGQSVVAGLGELGACDDKEKLNDVFQQLYFLMAWIYSFCTVSLMTLFNPFIEIAFGNNYLFSYPVVLLLCVNFYVSMMRSPVLALREATGAFVYDKYKPLFESAINLVASILLGQIFGIAGIFMGTFISTMTTCFWVEPYVTFKNVLKQPLFGYFKKYGIYFLLTAVSYLLVTACAGVFPVSGIVGFIVKGFVCLIVPNAVWFVAFRKSKEYCYYDALIRRLLSKLRQKAGNKPEEMHP